MPRQKNTFTPQDADLRRITEAFPRLKAEGRDDRDIWSAFVTMAAAPIAMATGCAPDSLIEDARRHSARYAGLTGELDGMLSALVDALEADSDRDVMGYVHNALGLPINSRSQFFTPYNISRMIAQMMLADSVKAKDKGYVTICDPCAGSGGMLVAAFNVLREQGMNPQTDAWFEAQDVSQDTALMCYAQMSLLGMAGRVIARDSLEGTRSIELVTLGAVVHPAWATRHLPARAPRALCPRLVRHTRHLRPRPFACLAARIIADALSCAQEPRKLFMARRIFGATLKTQALSGFAFPLVRMRSPAQSGRAILAIERTRSWATEAKPG